MKAKKNVLLTGGAGYIGSHTFLSLIENGYNPIIIDNFHNSKKEVINRLEHIIKCKINLIEGDICEREIVRNAFEKFDISSVIHFAAFKSVEESVTKASYYLSNNIIGLLNIIEAMRIFKCNKIVFSSSACVYGDKEEMPVSEDTQRKFVNPYGQSKIICEDILETYKNSADLRYLILRYFNPIGCHESAMIGEDPKSELSNLMPNIAQVAIGKKPYLEVFGNDYNTIDGTGVRDYIHIMDLADGHVAALEKIEIEGVNTSINLGTGKGYSVFEIIRAYEKVSGKKIEYKLCPKRSGDVPIIFADIKKAKKVLNWNSKRDIIEMCRSSWQWQLENPDGY